MLIQYFSFSLVLKLFNFAYYRIIHEESPESKQMKTKDSKFFKKRVQKLNNMRDVSRREHKLLRKLLRVYKDKEIISWDLILYHFPGKRMNELKAYCSQHFSKYLKYVHLRLFCIFGFVHFKPFSVIHQT